MEASVTRKNPFRDLLSSALADVLQPSSRHEDKPKPDDSSVEPQAEGASIASPDAEPQQPATATVDPYAARVADIKQRYAADAEHAAEAKKQLQKAQQDARQKELHALAAADAAYTPAWREAGLPAKASQLSMDPSWLLGAQLLNPAAIMHKQQTQQQKEVVQPPTMFEYTNKDADPHYLQETSNLKVRQTIAQQRIAASRSPQHQHTAGSPASKSSTTTTSSSKSPVRQERGASPAEPSSSSSKYTSGSRAGRLDLGAARQGTKSTPWSQLPPEEMEQKMTAAASRYKAMSAVMTPEQREIEEQIIKKMYHRLSFLRNPRYATTPPQTAMQLSLQGTQKGHKHKQHKHSSPIRTRNAGAMGLYISPLEAGFRVTPADGVLFDSYELGGVYFQTVQLQNVTNIMKGLRSLPPASRYFQISLPRFPSTANELAAGMSTELCVCFTPDSLGEYEDGFTVETLTGQFEVALKASRPQPVLSLPEVLEVGDVLLGNSRSRTVQFTNKGGDGRYLLLPAADWAAAAQQHQQDQIQQQQLAAMAHLKPPTSSVARGPDSLNKTAATAVDAAAAAAAAAAVQDPSGSARSGAFDISPTFLDLPAGSTANFTVLFTPKGPGLHQGEFVLVCDNCTVQQLSVQGYGSEVDVQLVELDGRELHEGEIEAPIWFGQVHPGCCCSRAIKVQNSTQLQFPYKWQIDHQQQQQQQVDPQQQQRQSFAVYPGSGVIQPGAVTDFVIMYTPPDLTDHAAAAVLLVERSGDALLTMINTAVPGSSSSSSSLIQGAKQKTLDSSKLATTADLQQKPQQQQQQAPAGVSDAVVHLSFEGRGTPIVLQADPGAVITLPDQITIGEVAEQQLLLVNPSAAPAHVQISTQEEDQSQQAAGSSSSSRSPGSSPKQQSDAVAESAAVVMVGPASAVIAPQSSLEVSVKFLALAAGFHTGNLTVNIRHGSTLKIATKAYIKEACVVPSVPQLDFSILNMGYARVQQLQLVNTARACKAQWSVQQLEIAAPTCPPMLLQCEPSSGVLDASSTCVINVKLRGSCEGSHRLLLQVSSSSSQGRQQQQQLSQRQYVEVLVTVGVPKVVLDTYKIHLSSAYLGVHQQRTVMLTNTSRLPLQFTWSQQQIHQQQQQLGLHLSRTAAGSKQQQQQQQQQLASQPISSSSSSSSAQQPEGKLGVTIIPASGRLSPGEQLQLQLLLEPLAVGPVKLLCMCGVPGMKTLAGMVITAVIEGLQVAYAVEKPIQPSLAATISSMGSPGQRQQQQQISEQQQQRQHAQAGLLVADFGVVSLHQVTELLLRVTNQTSIDTTVRAWLSRFPAAAAAAAAAAGDSSSSIGQQAGLAALGISHDSQQSGSSAQPQHQQLSNMLASAAAAGDASLGRSNSPSNRIASSTLPGSPAAAAAGSGATAVRAVHTSSRAHSPSAARQQQHRTSSPAQQQQGKSRTGSPGFSTSRQQQQQQGVASRLAQTLITPGKAGFVSPSTGQLEGPFRASAGNTMMAARLIASAAAAALGGGCLGCAVDVQPGVAALGGWGRVVMRLLAYNNLPGTYLDVLSVQVGELPVQSIPLRLQVAGSPLVISRERVLLQGMQQLQHQQQQQRRSRSSSPAAAAAAGVWGATDSGTASSVVDSSAGSTAAAAAATGIGGHTALQLGLGVVPAGVLYERTFYVCNTGALPMHLGWNYQMSQPAAPAKSSDVAAAAAADTASEQMDPAAADGADSAPSLEQSAAAGNEPPPSDNNSSSGKALVSSDSKKVQGNAAAAAAAAARGIPAAAGAAAAAGKGKGTAAAGPAAKGAAGTGAAADAVGTAGRRVSSTAAAAAAASPAAPVVPAAEGQQDPVDASVDPAESEVSQAAQLSDTAAAAAAVAALTTGSTESILPEGGPGSLIKTLQTMSEHRKHHQQQQQQKGNRNPDDDGNAGSIAPVFVVEPLHCVILPQQQQKFTVKFTSERFGVHTVNLVGRQAFVQQSTGVDDRDNGLQLLLWPRGGDAGASGSAVGAVVSGGFHTYAAPPPTPMPDLEVHLSATTVAAELTPDDTDSLIWTVWSTHHPAQHDSYKHVITLSNTAGCPLVFQLGVEGPFELAAAIPSVVQDPDAFRGFKGAKTFTQSSKPPGTTTAASSNRSATDLLLLPPGESVDATVLLRPAAAALAAAAVLPAAVSDDSEALTAAVQQSEVQMSGALVVTAANGHQQRLPLSGVILHPIISARPAALSFGAVHPSAPRPLQLLLTNPTKVDAEWRAEIVAVEHDSTQQLLPKQAQNQQQEGALSSAGSTSARRKSVAASSTAAIPAPTPQQSAFRVQPDKGVLRGRGLAMPKTQQITVTFAPSSNAAASAELRIFVEGGSGCIVRLQGQGTYEETSEHLATLMDM